MIIAALIFVSGYKRYKIVPPGGNVLAKMIKVIYNAVSARIKKYGFLTLFRWNTNNGYSRVFGTQSVPLGKSHWLDEVIPIHGEVLVNEIKQVLGILYMFLPLPFFWTLFDQQSSRWVAQATLMDRNIHIFGYVLNIKPEQMQVTNAILVIKYCWTKLDLYDVDTFDDSSF